MTIAPNDHFQYIKAAPLNTGTDIHKHPDHQWVGLFFVIFHLYHYFFWSSYLPRMSQIHSVTKAAFCI